ncbi:ROK family protein [Paenibacillus gallinarum]|uniref:ROK family protein n=1 Tax=Paenibacillus gallinarum TaxID=2762232 RepID=A0ABR8SYL9_9BACL|nr:ROK family protein [Paenibacillus gallinarum]MBD7968490.1 ROK family protein [Paenibacillus gallinarum]
MNILACDIGGTTIKLGLCNSLGEIIEYKEYATEAFKGGMYIIEQVMDYMSDYDGYEAIGISTAGQVSPLDGSILYANPNIPNYTGVRLKDILEDRFDKPVKVENDVNAAALGEAWIGAGRSFADFICLTFGTGIGGAIVMQGEIYKGMNGTAGEFGHMVMYPITDTDAKWDSMYEKFASTKVLVQKAQAIDPKIINGKMLFSRIDEGEEELLSLLGKWEQEVSRGVATLIHIFNPPAVIVGGGIMEQSWLVERIGISTREILLDSFQHTPILPAELGNKAALIGAASLYHRYSESE